MCLGEYVTFQNQSFTILIFYLSCIDHLFFCLHLITVLRAESSLLKEHIEAQSKELSHRMHRIEKLEEKERVANENVSYLYLIDS